MRSQHCVLMLSIDATRKMFPKWCNRKRSYKTAQETSMFAKMLSIVPERAPTTKKPCRKIVNSVFISCNVLVNYSTYRHISAQYFVDQLCAFALKTCQFIEAISAMVHRKSSRPEDALRVSI